MKKILTLVTCCVLLISCTVQKTKYSGAIAEFEDSLASLQRKYQLPGISIGIAYNDSIIYSKGFGLADVENNIAMTGTTPLRIASITKPIFTTLLMKLVEEKKIDLNWKIKEHYPDYINTCARILSYFKSDMPEYTFLLDNYQTERDDILIRHHLSHTAENTPGTHYKYNGFLFGMLSVVVENATHFKFDKWVDSLIIERLNLKHSASSQMDSSKLDVLKHLAYPYKKNKQGALEKAEFPNLQLNAGAGLVFSAYDLLLFDKALNQNLLISKKSKEKMFTPVVLADNTLSPYGYGWFIQKYQGNRLVWHYGLQPDAYSALYLKIPEKNLTLVLLANSQDLSAPFDLGKGNVLNSEFAKAFLDIFLTNKK
ncbi:MAG: serine hydrolase domain-containing protein [Chitinophagaceae bacterium]